jgi:hypothetical protein
MRSRHFLLLTISLLVLQVFSAGSLSGQGVSGAINGTVTDPTGAVILNASVEATNVDTGVRSSTVTLKAGNYVIHHLVPGTYEVRVEATGFRRLVRENVVVSVDSIVRLDVQLQVGDLVEEITITGAAPVLQTDKAEISQVIPREKIIELPTIGRNAAHLITIIPGAVANSSQLRNHPENITEDFRVNVNGQSAGNHNRQIDGIDNNETIQGLNVINPTVESIAEMKITTNNYDAEFGQVGGAVIETVTRTGTNGFHGSLFEYLRNDQTFASDPFSGVSEVAPFKWNQFGGSAGGPIVRDKLFYFGDYQGVRSRVGDARRETIPIQAFRDGDFSLLPNNPVFDPLTGAADGSGRSQFSNNMIPSSRFDPAAKKLIELAPLPTLSGFDRNFARPTSTVIDTNQFGSRVDYNHSDNTRVFTRYTIFQSLLDVPALFGDVIGRPGFSTGPFKDATTRHQNLAFNYQRTISPTLLTEVRVGFSRYRATAFPRDADLRTADEVGIPGINQGTPATNGIPGFTISGPVGGFRMGGRPPFVEREQTVVIANNWTKIFSAHNTKFGADFRKARLKRTDSSNNGRGTLTFNQQTVGSLDVRGSGLGTASYMLGLPNRYNRGITLSRANELQTRMAFYASDQWRATQNLTFSLGLRWEYFSPISGDEPGGITKLDLATGEVLFNELGDINKYAGLEPHYRNFGPRFGIAYKLGTKTVLRLGYGRSFAIGGNFASVSQRWPNSARQELNATSLYTSVFILSDGPPPVSTPPDPTSGRLLLPDQIFYITGDDARQPYVESWNFTVQRQLASDVSFELAYVGNLGRQIRQSYRPNQPIPGPGPSNPRRPGFAPFGWTQSILLRNHDGRSNYNALQAKLDKRFSNGYSILGSFTWQRALDFGGCGQNRFECAGDYGPQSGQRRVYGVISHIWDVPFRAQGPARHFVEGWNLSGIWQFASGMPFTPTLASTGFYNSSGSTVRPDRAGGGAISNPTRDQWFDTRFNESGAPWTRPPDFTYGNSGRNILRGPGFNHVDLALGKTFQISETADLKFRWEVFNAFNRTNMDTPSSGVGSSTAGQVTRIMRSYFMRRMQFGLHLSW